MGVGGTGDTDSILAQVLSWEVLGCGVFWSPLAPAPLTMGARQQVFEQSHPMHGVYSPGWESL